MGQGSGFLGGGGERGGGCGAHVDSYLRNITISPPCVHENCRDFTVVVNGIYQFVGGA